MNLFLDACIIIYWVETADPFYSALIKKLENIYQKDHNTRLCVSRLSLLECLTKPLQEKDQDKLHLYHQFFTLPDLSIVEIDAHVIDLATQLRAFHKLRTPDAIQVASCLNLAEKHLFLTNDKRLGSIPDLNVDYL